MRRRTLLPFVLSAAVVVVTAAPALAAHGELTVTGLTQNGRLVSFPAADPSATSAPVKVTGIADGYQLTAIDYRPATDVLYAVAYDGSSFLVYTIVDGAATQASTTATPVTGAVSMDWNPTIDRLRVISTDDSNFVFNPVTGGVAQVTDLFYADGTDPAGVDLAYTNNDNDTATGTQLYTLEAAKNALVKQANSAGTLTEPLPLAVDLSDKAGFDIYTEGSTNVGIVSIFSKGRSTLYTLNVATGELTPAGTNGRSSTIGSTPHVIDVAVPTAQ